MCVESVDLEVWACGGGGGRVSVGMCGCGWVVCASGGWEGL